MSSSRMSLRAFLSSSRTALQQSIQQKTNVNLVIGNESADLDSITSALTFAYFRSTNSHTHGQKPYIPLLNLHRDDLRIRPELLALLPQAGITEHHLLTLDDIISSETASGFILSPEKTRWILVDHNVMQGQLGHAFGECVVGCIDHHKDEGKIPSGNPDEPHVIETSGSCQSLVVNHFKDVWSQRSSPHSHQPWTKRQTDEDATNADAEIAKLALASILIDTQNLQSESKVTLNDTAAVDSLEKTLSNLSDSTSKFFDRHGFYESIKAAKEDTSRLSVSEILRKDYKQWQEGQHSLGVSSILSSLEDLHRKLTEENQTANNQEPLIQALEQFSQERKLSVAVVMAAFNVSSGEFQRQILIKANNKALSAYIDKFIRLASSDLDLTELEFEKLPPGDRQWRAFQQRDTTKSRKQVGPWLREAFK